MKDRVYQLRVVENGFVAMDNAAGIIAFGQTSDDAIRNAAALVADFAALREKVGSSSATASSIQTGGGTTKGGLLRAALLGALVTFSATSIGGAAFLLVAVNKVGKAMLAVESGSGVRAVVHATADRLGRATPEQDAALAADLRTIAGHVRVMVDGWNAGWEQSGNVSAKGVAGGRP